jgi:hypothetical protein
MVRPFLLAEDLLDFALEVRDRYAGNCLWFPFDRLVRFACGHTALSAKAAGGPPFSLSSVAFSNTITRIVCLLV